jgi:hypothetical protein
LVKTVLEFHRYGKTYEIVVGYDIGDAFFYATPPPTIPRELGSARANGSMSRVVYFLEGAGILCRHGYSPEFQAADDRIEQ